MARLEIYIPTDKEKDELIQRAKDRGVTPSVYLRELEKENEGLKCKQVNLGQFLFRFESFQEWVNKASSWYSTCGVPKGFYITVDSFGRICTIGKHFMRAREEHSFPVRVFAIEALPELGKGGDDE